MIYDPENHGTGWSKMWKIFGDGQVSLIWASLLSVRTLKSHANKGRSNVGINSFNFFFEWPIAYIFVYIFGMVCQTSTVKMALLPPSGCWPGTMPPTSKIMVASGECGTPAPGGMPLLGWNPSWSGKVDVNDTLPPKTNMTGWKIHHEWRWTSYWTWGFSSLSCYFSGVSISTHPDNSPKCQPWGWRGNRCLPGMAFISIGAKMLGRETSLIPHFGWVGYGKKTSSSVA